MSDAGSAGVLPFVIAITGKQNLKGRDDAVRVALRHALDRIDAETRHTAKLLLSGCAIGADTIAIEEAEIRPNWTIVPILPLNNNLFEQISTTNRRSADCGRSFIGTLIGRSSSSRSSIESVEGLYRTTP